MAPRSQGGYRLFLRLLLLNVCCSSRMPLCFPISVASTSIVDFEAPDGGFAATITVGAAVAAGTLATGASNCALLAGAEGWAGGMFAASWVCLRRRRLLHLQEDKCCRGGNDHNRDHANQHELVAWLRIVRSHGIKTAKVRAQCNIGAFLLFRRIRQRNHFQRHTAIGSTLEKQRALQQTLKV